MNCDKKILDFIDCPKTASCLESCGFRTLNDMKMFNEESIANIEASISSFTRVLPMEQREVYLSSEFINNPESFRINPQIKSTLLSLAKEMSQLNSVCEPKKLENVEDTSQSNGVDKNQLNHEDNNQNVKPVKSKNMKKEEKVKKPRKTSISKTKKSNGPPTNGTPFESSLPHMILESEEMHRVVMRHAHTKFFNCDLLMERDFLIFRDLDDCKLGYYQCVMCRNRGAAGVGNKDVIKYRYALYGSLIFMNIQVHLEKHFSRVQPNKRRQSSKKEPVSSGGPTLQGPEPHVLASAAATGATTVTQSAAPLGGRESSSSSSSEVVELLPKLARLKQPITTAVAAVCPPQPITTYTTVQLCYPLVAVATTPTIAALPQIFPSPCPPAAAPQGSSMTSRS